MPHRTLSLIAAPVALFAFFALLALPGAAQAASSAVTTADLNMRTGPSTSYPRIATIPDGDRVTVYGCTRGYNWCDVVWDGYRGWVYSGYLAHYDDGRYIGWDIYGPRIGFPIFSFSFGDYHDRHYRGRPWYRHRDRRDYDRYHRRERYERRRDRREEYREERRERRRDLREGRREDLRERRRELREERRDRSDAGPRRRDSDSDRGLSRSQELREGRMGQELSPTQQLREGSGEVRDSDR